MCIRQRLSVRRSMVVSDQTVGKEIPIEVDSGVNVETPADAEDEEVTDDDSEREPKREQKPKREDPALEQIYLRNILFRFCVIVTRWDNS